MNQVCPVRISLQQQQTELLPIQNNNNKKKSWVLKQLTCRVDNHNNNRTNVKRGGNKRIQFLFYCYYYLFKKKKGSLTRSPATSPVVLRHHTVGCSANLLYVFSLEKSQQSKKRGEGGWFISTIYKEKKKEKLNRKKTAPQCAFLHANFHPFSSMFQLMFEHLVRNERKLDARKKI